MVTGCLGITSEDVDNKIHCYNSVSKSLAQHVTQWAHCVVQLDVKGTAGARISCLVLTSAAKHTGIIQYYPAAVAVSLHSTQ